MTGTATAAIATTSTPPPDPVAAFDLHLDIDITSGTGEYAGATGSATYDLDEQIVEQAPGDFIITFTGTVAGSFDVPI